MKLVVLDDYTLNPGDLNWKELEDFCECEFYPRSSSNEVLKRAEGAEILLTNKTLLNRPILEALPKLRYVGVLATGYNVVDTQAASERGILVSNVPNYGQISVAQATFALLLELCNRVGQHDQAVRDGQWGSQPDFCFWNFPLVELAGLTMGIIGYGSIGREVAKLAHAFSMKVLVHTRTTSSSTSVHSDLQKGNIQFVDSETLLQESDVVSLHCPLTLDNEGFINRQRLKLMKNSAFLINTSRGKLIQEEDLLNALNQEEIAGAALDVLSTEPPKKRNPLFDAKNCIITPHIAWASKASRQRLMNIAVENVRCFLQNKPQNLVTSK